MSIDQEEEKEGAAEGNQEAEPLLRAVGLGDLLTTVLASEASARDFLSKHGLLERLEPKMRFRQ